MEAFYLFLQYLKVVTSPQLIIGVVAVIFFRTFPKQIGALIDRIIKIGIAGASLDVSQPAPLTAKEFEYAPATQPAVTLVKEPDSATEFKVLKLTAELNTVKEESEKWEFNFLNYFLVLHTQQVLDWLIYLARPTTFSSFESAWGLLLPNPVERLAVITALTAYGLVLREGDTLTVTDKARRFVAWRGPLDVRLGLGTSPILGPVGYTAAVGRALASAPLAGPVPTPPPKVVK